MFSKTIVITKTNCLTFCFLTPTVSRILTEKSSFFTKRFALKLFKKKYWCGKKVSILLILHNTLCQLRHRFTDSVYAILNHSFLSKLRPGHRTKITAIAALTSKIRSHRLTKSAPGKW